MAYGAFGENLVVDGFDFRTLPVGTLLAVGDVLLQMTQIGKECHNHCAIYKAVGDCIMPREGVFAKVLHGGHIKVGDEMKLIPAPEPLPWQAAVITLSDKGARGEREDKSGPAIVQRLEAEGYEVVEQILLADDAAALKTTLTRLADQRQLDLILTTGGTGFGPRDVTPEATMAGHPSGPRHCRGHPGCFAGHHPPRDALPRGVGHPGEDADRQPARQPESSMRKHGCVSAADAPRAGAPARRSARLRALIDAFTFSGGLE